MFKVDFRPLEYIEVLEKKPLNIKIGRYIIKFDLETIKNFLYFNTNTKQILKNIDDLNKLNVNTLKTNTLKIINFRALIHIIYNLTKQQFNFLSRIKYKFYIFRYLMGDTTILLEVVTKIFEYNTSLKKKLENLRNFNIWQTNAFQINGEDSYLNYIRMTESGQKYLIPRYSLN